VPIARLIRVEIGSQQHFVEAGCGFLGQPTQLQKECRDHSLGELAALQLGSDLSQPGHAACVLEIWAIRDRQNRFDLCL
jgi:hypothetical protein